MIFKIKWGDMERALRNFREENQSPIFYFENETEIYVYQARGYIVLCAEATLDSFENIQAFKMEFLSKATELLERPKENTLVIKQE